MSARRPSPSALALVLACSLLTGCRLGGAVGRSVTGLFASPRKVATLKEPIAKDARLAVLWVGHATALVQIDDKVILTDPVFTSTVGQLSKRLVEPGLDPANLPPVDAVLISHLHFDHLSLGSLAMIEGKVRMLLMPPRGVSYLTDFSFPALELARWQPWEKDGLRVTAVPVEHVGFRYGLDDAWMPDSFTGYVIEYHGLKVYFGGDTAYDTRAFAETGARFPNLDLALLPIAPIEPRDFMRRTHMDPREALQAFFDLGARRMVPIHYGTFINSTDDPGDPLRELAAAEREAARSWSFGAREVVPIAIGERRVFVRRGDAPPPAAVTAPARAAPRPPESPRPPKSDPAAIPDDDRLD